MFCGKLPMDVERHILTYDSTFVSYFREEVIPELMEMAWKRLTYQFFMATLDFTFYVEEMYEMLSDFEEEAEEDHEEAFVE